MASIAAIRENNSRIPGLYGSGLVAVFVGGTSGIGEATARAFIRSTNASQMRQINPDSRISFIKSDESLLREVDEACSIIQQREDEINILFLSPGVGTIAGREETDEGLDRKLNLHYYSRMRFVTNFLPQLKKACDMSEQSPNHGQRLSRVVSVLEAGGEAALHLDDLSLKAHYSLRNCAKHAITMNSVSMEHLASSYPQISFVHSFPGVVITRLGRELSTVMKHVVSAFMVLARPWEIALQDSGERHLYTATSPRFPPLICKDDIPDAAEGSDGNTGSGLYRLSATGFTYKSSNIMALYRAEGVRNLIWKHTLDVFEKVRSGIVIET
ncbi:hypothetical protein BO71DRAFT_450045 [Aspergillus ellipticus CBS 707.79]|uniref:NAD(P)-binding protein n=1 Tax=Aspergillus ellipticus CBS 707.79 TaxID=1448320 RepID=A0A319ETJ4_9EURO|nr:hypothetical protein BO71DRAFT_450045 [Aspergillus ellipticus CBS 707.79]